MSAYDQLLSQCNKDIEEVQRELDANLTLLAENVDQGFGQLRKINKQCTDIAEQLKNSGFGKAADVVSLAGFAISGFGSAYNAAKAASAHNEALDKLMQQKVKIANAKFDSISRVQKLAERNDATFFKALSHDLVQEYNESDLVADPAITNDIISEIHRVEATFKMASYNLMMVNFLLDEYKAWMNYQQRSETSRPVMSFVNNRINDWMFDCNNGLGLDLQSVISRNGRNGKITGAELLFLTDPSITACSLYGQMSKDDDMSELMSGLMPDLKPTGVVHDIGVEPVGIAKTFIGKNSAYQKYQASLSEYNGWWHVPAYIAFIIVGISFLIDIESWMGMSEWWAFFRWGAMIFLVLIEYAILTAACPTLFDDGERRKHLNWVCNKAKQKQLGEMGFVKIYEPNYKKKSVAKAAVMGAIKGILD